MRLSRSGRLELAPMPVQRGEPEQPDTDEQRWGGQRDDVHAEVVRRRAAAPVPEVAAGLHAKAGEGLAGEGHAVGQVAEDLRLQPTRLGGGGDLLLQRMMGDALRSRTNGRQATENGRARVSDFEARTGVCHDRLKRNRSLRSSNRLDDPHDKVHEEPLQ